MKLFMTSDMGGITTVDGKMIGCCINEDYLIKDGKMEQICDKGKVVDLRVGLESDNFCSENYNFDEKFLKIYKNA